MDNIFQRKTADNYWEHSNKVSVAMKIIYNDTTQKIDTCNNQIIPGFYNMSDNKQMPESEQIP